MVTGQKVFIDSYPSILKERRGRVNEYGQLEVPRIQGNGAAADDRHKRRDGGEC